MKKTTRFDDPYLQYQFSQFSTDGNTGFKGLSLTKREFHFSSPTVFDEHAPWNRPLTPKQLAEVNQWPKELRDKRKAQAKMTNEEFDRWVNDNAKHHYPSPTNG